MARMINGKDEEKEMIYVEDYIAEDVREVVEATKLFMKGELSERMHKEVIEQKTVDLIQYVYDRG